MKLSASTLFTLALLCAALPAMAASERYSIRAESIAAAMNGVGMQVEPKQVTLLSDVVATSSAPRLRVESMEKSTGHGVLVRLECATSEECLPFYARIRPSAEDEAKSSTPALPAQFQDPQSREARSRTVEMRVGSTATLLLDGQRVHISLPVICMENGAVGQKIRVTSPDRQRTYMAEVIDGARLKGSL